MYSQQVKDKIHRDKFGKIVTDSSAQYTVLLMAEMLMLALSIAEFKSIRTL